MTSFTILKTPNLTLERHAMNPMNIPIYKAIVTLCELKDKATYTEIASVANIKRQEAIDYILRNKHLLKMDKKGNIIGFISHDANVRRIVHGMFTMGLVYKTEEINYGSDKAIMVHENHFEKVKHLLVDYWVGGIGDCYHTKYIILNDTTKKAMNDLGFRDFNEVVKEKLDKGEDQVWHSLCTP